MTSEVLMPSYKRQMEKPVWYLYSMSEKLIATVRAESREVAWQQFKRSIPPEDMLGAFLSDQPPSEFSPR